MPAVGAAIVAAVAKISVAEIIVGAVVSFALNTVTSAIFGRPETPDLTSFASIKTRGATQQFRQPVTERRLVYGEVRTSGPIVFASVSESNKYLHMIVALASHEVEEIGEVFINDVSIPIDDLDGDGIVQSGRYANLVRIKKYLGTDSQTADSDLVSEVSEWTTDHRLRGIAYIYVRYEWDRDVFTTGIPNLSAWVKGKKCLDSRDSVTRWTPNISLQTNDYLVDSDFGLEANQSDVDLNELDGAANTCEEFVTTANLDVNFTSIDVTNNIITLDGDRLTYQTGDRIQVQSGTIGGLSAATNYYVIAYQRKDTPRIQVASSLDNAIAGTAISLTSGTTGTLRKNAEPRYFGGGVIKTSAERGENLKEIMSGMAGQTVYAGGKWRILAGEYQTPTISFNEGDLAGSVEVSTRISKKERFNRVQGIYISPLNDGNPSDYPLVSNSTYQAEDGEVLRRNLDLSFTQRPHTAQRIAKISLERMRQEIIFTARFKMTAFKVQVGDNFYMNFDRYGWSNKVFEVLTWSLDNQDGVPVIEMTCRENASSVYDWNSGEETQVDPAPNTNLPNPFDVDPPTSLVVTPIETATQQDDKVYEFVVAWTPPSDPFVTSGGYYEVQFKKTSDLDWRRSYRAEDIDTDIRVTQVEPQVNYDVRIRSVNYLRVRSQYVTLSGFTVDSPSGATIQKDYLFFQGSQGSVTETFDYGLFSDGTIGDTIDYGNFV